ncbi:hypothetical protein AVEN_77157-1 [Araneus ventricosus]|uniref:Uncharacterized protein n=1 Tax=Araneus ventricosus TaxID=182803 RepID=A0A4Y2IET0_ARAVE|nr:hypothetical protein AVEN_77157-1 [Araneus ventricosus]
MNAIEDTIYLTLYDLNFELGHDIQRNALNHAPLFITKSVAQKISPQQSPPTTRVMSQDRKRANLRFRALIDVDVTNPRNVWSKGNEEEVF